MAKKGYFHGRLKPEMLLSNGLLDPATRGTACPVVDCEQSAATPKAWYCVEHAAERQAGASASKPEAPRKRAEKVESITEGTPPPTPPKGSPDERKLAEWCAMVLVILTYVVGLRAAGGQGLLMRGADKELATRLAMTDSQADNIARVAAKKIAPTRFYKRAGNKVVDVLDMEVVAAVESMWEWASSVAPYLRQSHQPADVTVMSSPATYNGSTNGTQHAPAAAVRPGAIPLHRIDN